MQNVTFMSFYLISITIVVLVFSTEICHKVTKKKTEYCKYIKTAK
ncbi:MAG: hypothetical protein K0R16_1767 [Nitrososphaeraceae archaeon]|jgi:hypothetical protein|nr:hypothetical protein [Nitrososphaeraceae archaeon]MDF2768805.1 hypothetical protein [Nitrososphaeraceae archaeon]